MRRVIIVSPYFPPSTLAGVHRARFLAKHLPAAGWKPVIVCVDETFHEEQLDPQLAALVPDDAEIVKVAAMPVGMTRPFGLGDIGVRGFLGLRNAVLKLASQEKTDAIMITGSPYYPMLLTQELSRRCGVPVILDFQDPWVSSWGKTQTVLSKQGLSHRLARFLEPKALRHASWITSVSERQNADMAADYSWLDPERMSAIPIGGDPDDFLALENTHRGMPPILPEPQAFNFSYVGTFLPRAEPTVRQLLRAFAVLRSESPAAASSIRFNFIGTSNQPNETSTYRVMPIALAEGVADCVHEIPRRLPYLDALAALRQSDAILLLGSDEPHYTASKIYPALMSGRPYLSIFHRASSAHTLLSSAAGGLAFSFGQAHELKALETPLKEAVLSLASGERKPGAAHPAAFAPFRASEIARQFASVFDAAVHASARARSAAYG